MLIDPSSTYNAVASEPPAARDVKEVAKTPPVKNDLQEGKVAVTTKEPEEVKTKGTPSTEEVVQAAAEIEVHLRSLDTDLKFEVDIEDNEVVVKVLDPETNEVIRQVPSEEVMAIREKLSNSDKQVGVLHDIRT
ncbi:MAG: flagellar protein FlaG [Proteobacteria bacterium]|nr:flagellar protein FlaG [Pseudomonadota bacterium]